MQSKTSHRHRKPSPARVVAKRTAISAGAAAAALLVSAGGATAAEASTAPEAPVVAQAPAAEPPCTGTALDAIVGPLSGADCNSNPQDPEVPDDSGETPGDPGTTPPPPPGG